MKVIRSEEVPAQQVQEEGAQGTTVRWLISGPEGHSMSAGGSSSARR